MECQSGAVAEGQGFRKPARLGRWWSGDGGSTGGEGEERSMEERAERNDAGLEDCLEEVVESLEVTVESMFVNPERNVVDDREGPESFEPRREKRR